MRRRRRSNPPDLIPALLPEFCARTSISRVQDELPQLQKSLYHSTSIPLGDGMVLSGGIDHLRVPYSGYLYFDKTTHEFSYIDITFALEHDDDPAVPKSFLPVRSHTAHVVSSRDDSIDVFYFGGVSTPPGVLNRFQLIGCRFDVKDRNATVFRASLVEGLGLRYGHSTWVCAGKAYLFGGDENITDRNLYCLDLTSEGIDREGWVELPLNSTQNPADIPPAVFGQTTEVIEDDVSGDTYLYMFFGATGERSRTSAQVYRFSLRQSRWSRVSTQPHHIAGRFGHSSVKSPSNQLIFLFGGSKNQPIQPTQPTPNLHPSRAAYPLSNELLCFDYRTGVFTSLSHPISQPRFGHVMTLLPSFDLHLLGGVSGRFRTDYRLPHEGLTGLKDLILRPLDTLFVTMEGRAAMRCFADVEIVCVEDGGNRDCDYVMTEEEVVDFEEIGDRVEVWVGSGDGDGDGEDEEESVLELRRRRRRRRRSERVVEVLGGVE